MANEIRLGSNFRAFYQVEASEGTLELDLNNYIDIQPCSNAKINIQREIVETKGLGVDYVSENQYGKYNAVVTLDCIGSSVLETLIGLFDAGTEGSVSFILEDSGASKTYEVAGCHLSKIKASATAGELIKITAE